LVSGDAIRPYHLPVDAATPIEPKEQWEEARGFMLILRTLGSMVVFSNKELKVVLCSARRRSRLWIPEFPVGARRHTQRSGRRGEVLREQRRHLVGGLLGQPVRRAVEFGETVGPGDVAPA
jgi:hypothetical protein